MISQNPDRAFSCWSVETCVSLRDSGLLTALAANFPASSLAPSFGDIRTGADH